MDLSRVPWKSETRIHMPVLYWGYVLSTWRMRYMADKETRQAFALSWGPASAWFRGNSKVWMESQEVPFEARVWWFIQLPPCPSVFSNRFLSWVGVVVVVNLLAEWCSSAKSSSPEMGVAWVRSCQHCQQPEEASLAYEESWMGCQSTQCRMHHSVF